MPDIDRLVEVRACRQGSGYLIADRLVLTAWHVVRPPSLGAGFPASVFVRVEGDISEGVAPASTEIEAQVIWPPRDPSSDLDFALLRLSRASLRRAITAVEWAVLDEHGRLEIRAMGYPDSAIDYSCEIRDIKEIDGWVQLGDGHRQRREQRGTFVIRQIAEDLPKGDAAGAWSAMSGAPVST